MLEEYVTVKEYMKRMKLGYDSVMKLIETKQVDFIQTPSGKYRIKIGSNTVPRQMYDDLNKKYIELKTKVKSATNILIIEE